MFIPRNSTLAPLVNIKVRKERGRYIIGAKKKTKEKKLRMGRDILECGRKELFSRL